MCRHRDALTVLKKQDKERKKSLDAVIRALAASGAAKK